MRGYVNVEMALTYPRIQLHTFHGLSHGGALGADFDLQENIVKKPQQQPGEQSPKRSGRIIDDRDSPAFPSKNLPQQVPVPLEGTDDDLPDELRPYKKQEEHQRQLPRQNLMPAIRMNAPATQAALDWMEAEGRPTI